MTKKRLFVILLLIILLFSFHAYDWWQYNRQYKALLSSYNTYRELSTVEDSIQTVWYNRLAMGWNGYDWVENKSFETTFNFSKLRENLSDKYINPRYSRLINVKKKLLFITDESVKRLNLLTNLDLHKETGELSESNWNKYDLSIAKSAATNDIVIKRFKISIPLPDIDNQSAKLKRITKEPWLKDN